MISPTQTRMGRVLVAKPRVQRHRSLPQRLTCLLDYSYSSRSKGRNLSRQRIWATTSGNVGALILPHHHIGAGKPNWGLRRMRCTWPQVKDQIRGECISLLTFTLTLGSIAIEPNADIGNRLSGIERPKTSMPESWNLMVLPGMIAKT